MNSDQLYAIIGGYVSVPPSGITEPGISRIEFPSILEDMRNFAASEAEPLMTTHIVKEGWTPWQGTETTTPWDLFLYWGSYRFEKENYILIFERKNREVRIYKKKGEGILRSIKNEQLFSGECPTIHDFQFITRLLKIK